jgi:1-acyl-sn-glycerol-3-phosphate acyltransferase
MPDVQSEGVVGKLVSGMIRRTVVSRFRTVYWTPPATVPAQCIFVATHHGWHDGYLIFQVVNALGRRSLDWIQEYHAFPLFGKVGGMPFPAHQPAIRAATVKKTIRLMRDEGRSLILFGEGILHRGPDIWSVGRSLEVVAKQVPEAVILPIAIRYDMSVHERPEAFITVGEPVVRGENLLVTIQEELARLWQQSLGAVSAVGDEISPEYEVLVRGTLDVNERFDRKKRTE